MRQLSAMRPRKDCSRILLLLLLILTRYLGPAQFVVRPTDAFYSPVMVERSLEYADAALHARPEPMAAAVSNLATKPWHFFLFGTQLCACSARLQLCGVDVEKIMLARHPLATMTCRRAHEE